VPKKAQITQERVEYNVFLFDESPKGSKSLKIFKISLTFRFDKLSNLSKSVHIGENSQILTVSNKKKFFGRFSYIIYQGTDILPEIFSSSPDRRVFAARKLHEGFSPRVILSDKHECWTARKNFWRYISVPRYIRKRIARKKFSLGQLYRKFSLGKISA
jgi:hypothetical protein